MWEIIEGIIENVPENGEEAVGYETNDTHSFDDISQKFLLQLIIVSKQKDVEKVSIPIERAKLSSKLNNILISPHSQVPCSSDTSNRRKVNRLCSVCCNSLGKDLDTGWIQCSGCSFW